MDRPPISLRRLTYLPNGLVHYQGTRVHPRLGTDHQLLPAVEFLALLAGHVLLQYQVTKRSYGALSTTCRKRVGWIKAPPVNQLPPEALTPFNAGSAGSGRRGGAAPSPGPTRLGGSEEVSELTRSRRRNWAKLIAKVHLCDPESCPGCEKPRKILAAISSPYQDEVIEEILRQLKLWAPPWKRERKARGPPPRHEREEPPSAEPIDPE